MINKLGINPNCNLCKVFSFAFCHSFLLAETIDMNKLITVKSNNGNYYQYDFNSGILTSISPHSFRKMDKVVRNRANELGLDSSYSFTPIRPQDIIFQFINMPDLVFELTERCNLRCDYCIYGEAYNNFANRSETDLNPRVAKNIIDFIWEVFDQCNIGETEGVIGFYGGEPLLQFETIKEIIDYVKQKQINSKLTFRYNMTTNAVLLSESIVDFLDKNNVELLISLDGDKINNSFRHFASGDNSFDVVIRNLDLLVKNHFEYFEKYVGFNSVIHKRNSKYEADSFIFGKYGKHPLLSDLDIVGMRENYKDLLQPVPIDKKDEKTMSIYGEDNISQNPVFSNAIRFMYNDLNYVYCSYIDFFLGKKRFWKPTGTCLPFGRKIFVNSKGFVYPCENVHNISPFGKVSEDACTIDFEQIAEDHNSILNKVAKICYLCYRKYNCNLCVYNNIDVIHDDTCKYFMNRKNFESYLVEIITDLENHPDMFTKIINRVSIA